MQCGDVSLGQLTRLLSRFEPAVALSCFSAVPAAWSTFPRNTNHILGREDSTLDHLIGTRLGPPTRGNLRRLILQFVRDRHQRREPRSEDYGDVDQHLVEDVLVLLSAVHVNTGFTIVAKNIMGKNWQESAHGAVLRAAGALAAAYGLSADIAYLHPTNDKRDGGPAGPGGSFIIADFVLTRELAGYLLEHFHALELGLSFNSPNAQPASTPSIHSKRATCQEVSG